MVEQKRGKAEKFFLENLFECHRKAWSRKTKTFNIDQKTSSIFIMQMLYTKASTTEEPDAGKPHVRVCAGGAG